MNKIDTKILTLARTNIGEYVRNYAKAYYNAMIAETSNEATKFYKDCDKYMLEIEKNIDKIVDTLTF